MPRLKRLFEVSLLCVVLSSSVVAGEPVELNFSKIRTEKVLVAESGAKIQLQISFKAPTSQRPAVVRAMSRTDARILAFRALSTYLKVPADHELVLSSFQVEEGRIDGGLYLTLASIDRNSVSIVPKTNTSVSSAPQILERDVQQAPNEPPASGNQLVQTSPLTSGDGLPRLSRNSGPVVISKELIDASPKLPGLRSQAYPEYISRITFAFGNLYSQFPRTIDVNRHGLFLRSCGEDIAELASTLTRDASEDLRLTQPELASIRGKIDSEVKNTYEVLEKIQPN